MAVPLPKKVELPLKEARTHCIQKNKKKMIYNFFLSSRKKILHLFAPYGGQGRLRLEGRTVVQAGSFAHDLSCPRHYAAFRQISHLSKLFRFPDPLLSRQRHFSGAFWRMANDDPKRSHISDGGGQDG
jgi:hypothetical protein